MIRSMSMLVLTTLIAFGVFASPVRLTIRVEPAAEVPAIPVTLHVEVTNPTTAPVTIPNAVAMQVIPPEGEPFVAVATIRGEAGVTGFPGVQDSEITLAPKETRELTFWSSPDSALFSNDKRLHQPGRYRLQLVVASELWDLDYLQVKTLVSDAQLVDPIVSNEVTFTALEPKGDDAIVFAWISSGPKAYELADRIWQNYPNSRYAPYYIPFSRDHEKEIAFYEAAIAKAPASVIADRWRLNVASSKLTYRPRVVNDADLARADAVMRNVERALKDLIKRVRDPQVRAEAAAALENRVLSYEDLLHDLRMDRGELTDIEPSIICAAPYGEGRSVAWLAYYNPTKASKSSPVGERNKFTPPPFDRGQPTTFSNSVLSEWFKVVFDSPTLTWHIDATNLRIDPRAAPRVCPPDMDEHHDEYFSGEREWPKGEP